MKKLVFLFAMFFAVSMVFAQKTTWVTQSGFGNEANVTQNACASGDATSIYAVQSGTWNSLTTMQTGSDNYLELIQSGDNNSADMEQYTCDADEDLGDVNNADIYQSGNSNTAVLTQKEVTGEGMEDLYDYSNNVANAFQSGNNNSYELSQGSKAWTPDNESYLTQSGNSNDAIIDQKGYTNYSEIVQNGDWNDAELDQFNDADYSPQTSESYSWQLGANNELDIDQFQNSSLQYVNSVQNGNTNTTDVKQASLGPQEVISQQKGTNDVINVEQIK